MSYIPKNMKIAVVGLGYVGMPLAVALAKYGPVVGYDVNQARVEELRDGRDSNSEVQQKILRASPCKFTFDINDIKDAQIYIITVPTPVKEDNDPDLTLIENATKSLARFIKKGDIIVYESTVYPGVTENICGVILEKHTGLKSGKDFFLGYSPERINPGDQKHTVENITKVVAAQTDEAAGLLADIYGQINGGKIFKAKNIKTAEASKAIENAQRDINIAFINEITMILKKMGLSSLDVLEAAGTKWNFLPFKPGLVGGHCIGVDPYYLAKSALDNGHDPDVILAGRKINNHMGYYIAENINENLHSQSKSGKNILILGFAFKENINDVRNTKVIDVVKQLTKLGHTVDIHDPYAFSEEVKKEYGLNILKTLPRHKKYDCLTLAVNHKFYSEMTVQSIESLLNRDISNLKPLIYDIKGAWRDLKFSARYNYETL